MGEVSSCFSRPIKVRSEMTPTCYVYTETGIYTWIQYGTEYEEYGSPKAGDAVTEQDMAKFRAIYLDEDLLLAYGSIALPGAPHVEGLNMSEPLQKWIDSSAEVPMEPFWPSIDPHHHFEARAEFAAPEFVMQGSANSFGVRQGALTYDRLAKDWEGNNIVGSVYIESGYMYDEGGFLKAVPYPEVGETRAVQAIADKSKAPMAIVCTIDLSLGRDRVKEILVRHREVGKNLVGVRHSLAWHKNACLFSQKWRGQVGEISKQDSFREGVKVLGEEGLTYDCWLFHFNLPELIELAKACPDTVIICDHIGGPVGNRKIPGYSLDKTMKEWKPLITELAKCSNVRMKLGGCGMPVCGFGFESNVEPPSSTELAKAWEPWFSHCLKSFGWERCFFESNFQPDKASGSFTSFWNAFKILAKRLLPRKEASQRALFYDNAVRTYCLDKAPFNFPSTSKEAEAMSPPLPSY